MKKRNLVVAAAALIFITGITGCKKMFDMKPKDTLDESQMYQNVYDADAAVLGVYGKFMGLADEYIILNELRADLLDVTNNADENLRQVSTHTVTDNNPYVSPRPFYEVILNCNDVLEHFLIMKQENKMKETEFNQRYSDVAALRSFLYLQLGIHYGSVPYVTSSLKNVDDVRNSANFPKLSFNVLLDSLINFTEKLPFKDIYPTGTNLNITVDGYPTEKFYINKKCLLGDLYLWKNDYLKAATYYRDVMEIATTGSTGEVYYSQYRIGWFGQVGSTGAYPFYVAYARAGDASTLAYSDGWRYIFETSWTSDLFKREWIWALPFDSKFQPKNSLINLFSPTNGDYLVKPSQQIYDLWNGETQRASAQGGAIPYDSRKLLSTMNIGGQPVAMKFLYNYINYENGSPKSYLAKTGNWYLYRQTHLHLRYAEATNRTGRYKLAWGFWNNGVKGAYPYVAPSDIPSGSLPDVTNFQNTLFDVYPFNFDGREGTSPYYRGDWYRHLGIRARANLANVNVPAADSLLSIEAGLIKEEALENAFEGTRWADLLRISIRRNDPSFIADKVYDKLRKSGISSGAASAARARLMAKDWYLPFKW